MTYAGLKSMIFAGVKPDDPRVQGGAQVALGALHAGREPRPGRSRLVLLLPPDGQGARRGRADRLLPTPKATQHDWRAELIAALLKRQQPDGSWVNADRRWMEGDPNLSTAYALLTLAYCRPAK